MNNEKNSFIYFIEVDKMLKQILLLFKKIIVSSFLLYGYNLIAGTFGLMIPINIFTVLLISILGLPALFSLMIVLIVAF